MKNATLFREYVWLVNTIARADRISLVEINEQWVKTEISGGLPFARTTFNRHKDAIQDIFGIIIDCDRKDNYRYYISNPEVLHDESVQNWMLSTLSVNNIMADCLTLQDRILLEHIPSGDQQLQTAIEAMKQSRMVLLHYKRYQSTDVRHYAVEPYCIKLFHRRWYLLACFPDKGFGTFSFDRISHIELLDETFQIDKEFSATRYFSECFGVMVDERVVPERVVLRAYGQERHYLRDLPLHPSQHELMETDSYADFEYTLRPTNDFKAHLLSRGQWLIVQSPEWLARDVQQWMKQTLQRYDEMS